MNNESHINSDDNLNEDLRNQILLYWSGELTDTEADHIKSVIGSSQACQEYLSELNELDVQFENQSIEEISSDTVTEAIAEFSNPHKSEDNVKHVSFRWIVPLAAAALITLSFFLIQVFKPTDQGKDSQLTQINQVPSENTSTTKDSNTSSTTTYSDLAKLNRSSRLFSNFGTSSDSGNRSFKSTRDRLQKLKVKFNKS